jgi:hypothetical protein
MFGIDFMLLFAVAVLIVRIYGTVMLALSDGEDE